MNVESPCCKKPIIFLYERVDLPATERTHGRGCTYKIKQAACSGCHQILEVRTQPAAVPDGRE
jgi:hypothetical protein